MSKPLCMAVLLYISFTLAGLSEETRVIESLNDFGGKTLEIRYTKADKEFKLERKVVYQDETGSRRKVIGVRLQNDYNKLGIEKAIEFYSASGVLLWLEIQILPEKANAAGYSRVITHYNSEKQVTQKEVFYSTWKQYDAIYQKSIDYFDINGDRVKSVFFLTDEERKRTGYIKLVTHYFDGKTIRQEFYDDKGNAY